MVRIAMVMGIVMVMVIIAMISAAPTMFQAVDEMIYACSFHLLLREKEGCFYLVGRSPSEHISLQ